jgi:hypothetical protein
MMKKMTLLRRGGAGGAATRTAAAAAAATAQTRRRRLWSATSSIVMRRGPAASALRPAHALFRMPVRGKKNKQKGTPHQVERENPALSTFFVLFFSLHDCSCCGVRVCRCFLPSPFVLTDDANVSLTASCAAFDGDDDANNW